jgi:hypothetical protein
MIIIPVFIKVMKYVETTVHVQSEDSVRNSVYVIRYYVLRDSPVVTAKRYVRIVRAHAMLMDVNVIRSFVKTAN